MTGRLRSRLWLDVPAASRESGVPESTLRRWCADGTVKARRIGKRRGRWQVLASSLRNRGGR